MSFSVFGCPRAISPEWDAEHPTFLRAKSLFRKYRADMFEKTMSAFSLTVEKDRLNERFIAQLNVEKIEITKDGRIKFSHPSGAHDDMLWAFALAVYATKREETGIILF